MYKRGKYSSLPVTVLIVRQLMKKDYSVLLFQLDGNLASDVSTRCSGHPQEITRKLSSHQVVTREPSSLSSSAELN